MTLFFLDVFNFFEEISAFPRQNALTLCNVYHKTWYNGHQLVRQINKTLNNFFSIQWRPIPRNDAMVCEPPEVRTQGGAQKMLKAPKDRRQGLRILLKTSVLGGGGLYCSGGHFIGSKEKWKLNTHAKKKHSYFLQKILNRFLERRSCVMQITMHKLHRILLLENRLPHAKVNLYAKHTVSVIKITFVKYLKSRNEIWDANRGGQACTGKDNFLDSGPAWPE